ncbi:MAG: hypothetical protein IJW40_01495 [Clostridia bacterium]|nr:hypothetical protein [Clostridia bacterium]
MKRILAAILAAMLLLTSAVACANDDEGNNNNNDNDQLENNDDQQPADGETTGSDIIEPTVEAGTLGETLWVAFKDSVAANPEMSTEERANALITNPAIQFMGAAMPVDASSEYFTGFGEYKITGFDSAAVYMPMMGSIAFVGYVFELSEGTDVNTFLTGLTDNCDPRWNICVTADQTVAGAVGNTVFFLMCPAALSDGSEGGDVEVNTNVNYPITLEEGTVGYTIWTAFEQIMTEGALGTPGEIANAICEKQLVPFGLGAMEVAPGLLSGFDNYEVTDFSTGAVFMPMIGSIPFVGYILQVEDGVDVVNYISDLSTNCNPRWNVCVEADETLVGSYDNMVFFLMCPASIEE